MKSLHRIATGILVGLLVWSAPRAGNAAEPAESPSVLLEKGVYQEETAGDLPAAIEIYKQIVDNAQASRAYSAQALLRLGQCYVKQGRGDLANAAFDRVINEFPDQTALVEQAKQLRTDGRFTLLPAPWKDGEEMTLSLVAMTGAEVGTMIWSAKETTFDGKPAWTVASTMQVPSVGHKQTTVVTADRETFAPFLGETKNAAGNYKAIYKPTEILLTVNTQGKEITRTIKRDGIAFDNEQALYVIRRLPLEMGYQAEFPVFAVQGGVLVTCRIEVVATEQITTEKGPVFCNKLKLAVFIGGVKALEHQLWFSADEHKYLVKYDSGSAIMMLKDVQVRDEKAGDFRYTDPKFGYQLWLPAGWSIGTANSPQNRQGWALLAKGLDPSVAAYFTVADRDPKWTSIRDAADAKISQRALFLVDHATDASSWTNVPVAGEAGISWVDTYTDQGQPKAEYTIGALHGDLVYWFLYQVPADQLDDLKPTFDSIVEQFKFGEPAEEN